MAIDLALAGYEPILAPSVPPPEQPLSRLEVLRALRTNVLTAYAADAYRRFSSVGPFFGRRSLLTSDPEAIQHVLVSNPTNYTRTPATFRILRPVIGDGLLLSDGEDWRFQRRTLAPAFTPRAMSIVARVSAEQAAAKLAELQVAAGPGSRIDLLRHMQSLSLEIAARTLFSTTMDQRAGQLRRILERYSRWLGRPYPLDILLPPSWPSPADLARRVYGRRWLHFIAAMVEQRARMAREPDARDLFDLLTEAREAGSGRQFTFAELRDQFATMILAGHETTALTMTWALVLLAQAPAVQEAVAAEAAAALPAGSPDGDIVKAMPLTQAVVMETLRLFPPAFLIIRAAKAADQVQGIRLQAGDLVSIVPWILHRHEAHWQAPGRFDPRRFLPGAPAPKKGTYLPFGAGPRTCIGAQFALTEAVVVLGELCRHFRLSLDPADEIRPVAVVTTHPDPPPLFKLTRRHQPGSAAPADASAA